MGETAVSAIVLFHVGPTLPQHVKDCVTKIRQFSDSIPVYVIGNHHGDPSAVWVDSSSSPFDEVRLRLEGLQYFQGDGNPMWRLAAFRLFYIQQFMEDRDLTDVLHFDNDVLLFEDPDKIIETCFAIHGRGGIGRCAITAHSDTHVVFGMSYFPTQLSVSRLTNPLYEQMSRNWHALASEHGGYPSEMAILSKYAELSFLPIIPCGSSRYAADFEAFKSVFDPAAYGQFLSGTDAEKQPGYMTDAQEAGKLMIQKRLRVFMEARMPYIAFDGTKVKLNSLHIHSKNTGAYL